MSKMLGIFVILIILGVAVAAVFPYVTLNPANSRVELNGNFPLFYTFLVLHIGTALLALVSGLFQFSERFRIRFPARHRVLGRIYVVSVMVSGCLGLVITVYVDNFTKAMAFLALSFLWLFTTWKGFRYAVSKQFPEHRIWMIRSYAVTLVATSARLIVPLCMLLYAAMRGFHLPEGGIQQMVAEILQVNIWIGLLINFCLVEWVLLKPRKAR
ncbi:DUF2306 domain-containing protein [Paenibacillus planticolens]|uniref:DUF2306 domain-containing protein n=1 Tax=Paenibacillus planticolens TaxID=2654976 RepID=A0ABX1ZRA7_9BACL|nr:DUF2306 domain-containing protein [Paenibacillus planticolens]NOV02596.1 DUF2306 domain-containing protein [Paenibacillus planticolens]